MSTSQWKAKIEAELKQARAARSKGNEGQARVCARRAAGIAIGEYLQRQNLPQPGPSAIDRLRFLATLPDLNPQIQQICQHLTLRVTENFELPLEVDLLEETNWLIAELLSNNDRNHQK